MRSDEELRRALGRPDLPWPDETGAYERFLRRRVRRDRVMAAATGLALARATFAQQANPSRGTGRGSTAARSRTP